MTRHKKTTGEKTYLTALIPHDAEAITKWYNNPEITQYLDIHREVKSLETVKQDVDKLIKTGGAFAIFCNKTDTFIGFIVLDADEETIIILIGETDYRNIGCEAEAINFMLDFGFNTKTATSCTSPPIPMTQTHWPSTKNWALTKPSQCARC